MEASQDKTDSVKEGSTDLALSHVANAVTHLLTDGAIPAPIAKNVFKAFGQLCTAAVEIPVAHLEGITAEKKAETAARVKIITEGGDQIAAQMKMDNAFAQAAVQKYGQQILRQQVNLNKTCEVAASEINQQAAESEAADDQAMEALEINSDWLNSFENEASQKSSEEMQLLFGRILAGEIQRPSSFSLRTVKLLSQLDSETASLFRLMCSLCVYLGDDNQVVDGRVISLEGYAGSGSLKNYGLSFHALNRLNEHGLIIAEYNSSANYILCSIDENGDFPTHFTYQNRMWGFTNMTNQPLIGGFRLSGPSLSQAGLELSKIVDIQPNEEYHEALLEYFRGQGVQMVTIGSPV